MRPNSPLAERYFHFFGQPLGELLSANHVASGQNLIATGSSAGIGREIALRLASDGTYRVFVGYGR